VGYDSCHHEDAGTDRRPHAQTGQRTQAEHATQVRGHRTMLRLLRRRLSATVNAMTIDVNRLSGRGIELSTDSMSSADAIDVVLVCHDRHHTDQSVRLLPASIVRTRRRRDRCSRHAVVPVQGSLFSGLLNAQFFLRLSGSLSAALVVG
jgi:hypothetical protein